MTNGQVKFHKFDPFASRLRSGSEPSGRNLRFPAITLRVIFALHRRSMVKGQWLPSGRGCLVMRARMTQIRKNIPDFELAKSNNGCRETLESVTVSSCTRFSGLLTISSFGFNRLSSKLVGMFFGIVPTTVLKDFVRDCFVAQICAKAKM